MKTEQMHDAMHLYLQTNLSKSEIADYLNISRRSVNYWAEDYQWDRIKNCAGNIPMIMAENCYLIMAKLQTEILSDKNPDEPVSLKKINTLCKLSNTVRKISTRNALNENIELRGHFLDYVKAQNPEAASMIQPFIDGYILSQVKAGSKEFKAIQSSWQSPATTNQEPPAPQAASETSHTTTTTAPQPVSYQQLIDEEEARLDAEDLHYWAQNPPSAVHDGHTRQIIPQNSKPPLNKTAKMEMLKGQGLNRAQRRKIRRSAAA